MRLGANFGSDVLPLIVSLFVIAAVLYLCWLLSRYLSKRAGTAANTANIRILERVALAQDKGLAIAQICGQYYLIAFSAERVEILKELDETQIKTGGPGAGRNFMDALNAALKGGLDWTRNERKPKDGGN